MTSNLPKIIDSHAHVNFQAFSEDREIVIDNALNSGTWMVNVGSNFETSRLAVEIAEKHVNGVYAAIGVHPIHVLEDTYDEACMLDLAGNSDKVVAVGETGLDYFHLLNGKGKLADEKNPEMIKEKQKKLFFAHLFLAKKLGLPAILHCRHYKKYDAHRDMLAAMEEFSSINQDFILRGVMHCYTGSAQLAELYLRLGLYIGFTGVVTFSDEYDEAIETVPLERMLIETDCPYLSPEPKRGERNIPENVRFVGEHIARVKGMTSEEIFEQTAQNAVELFSLDKH